MKKHIDRLSDEELQRAKDRMNLEADTRNAIIRKMNTGKDYVDMVLGYADTGINTYNKIAKIYNITSSGKESPMPVIGEGGGNKKKKK